MLKIYPSPFNKLVFFILYGLLSVVVITIAQPLPTLSFTPSATASPLPNGGNGGSDGNSGKCILPLSPSQQTIIGYVQTKTINPATIQWDNYDFINVIAGLDAIRSPSAADLSALDTIVANKNSSTKSTKVLLSIRDSSWPPSEALQAYQDLITGTINTIKTHFLDGVDIQYPGMIGRYCNLWDPNTRDSSFSNFIRDLHIQTNPLNKTLMLTVGNDTIPSLDIKNNVDILNVETYHHSFYDNINNPDERIRIGPNVPFNAFKAARDKWVTSSGIDKEKIIMGVDLGNTLQLVDSRNITNDQTISANTRADSGVFNNLDTISICPNDGDRLNLYYFPWKQLFDEKILSSNDDDDCNHIKVADGWQRRDDPDTSPWLSRQVDNSQSWYYYISYEDFTSLSRKLNFVINSAGGISISDISYDTNDTSSSLINYMQIINGKQGSSTGPGGSPTSGSGGGGSGGETQAPTNENITQGGEKDKRGVIAGAVLGSVFGLVILSGLFFLGYKYKDKLQNKFGNEKMYHGTYTNQPGMIPEGSPRMIIPETTAVPVAPSFVTAMFDFAGKEENDLSFKKGDKIEVLERGDGPNDWWVGRVNGAVGEFPGNYVKE